MFLCVASEFFFTISDVFRENLKIFQSKAFCVHRLINGMKEVFKLTRN